MFKIKYTAHASPDKENIEKKGVETVNNIKICCII